MSAVPSFTVRNACPARRPLVSGPLRLTAGMIVGTVLAVWPLFICPMPGDDRADDFFPDMPDWQQALLALLLLAVAVRVTAAVLRGSWSAKGPPTPEPPLKWPWIQVAWLLVAFVAVFYCLGLGVVLLAVLYQLPARLWQSFRPAIG
ncbi:MAG: hypothetical protein HZB16_14230 [Armatimonadetes bacterium]|nr:hypothetical protein [Armatimonadota bacterium]